MNNSQQMLEALEQQDLSRADSFFEKALEEDLDEILLELGSYLEGIGFYPQASQIYEKLSPKFPEVNISLASIASEDGLIESIGLNYEGPYTGLCMDCFNGHYVAGLYDYEESYINSMTDLQKNFLKERGTNNE